MRRIHATGPFGAATALTLLALTLVAPDARADAPAWRFVYDTRVDGCPSRSQVRSQVVARLGFDPFHEAEADEAASELWIAIRTDDRGLVAVVERREDGAVIGERTLRASSDCTELAASSALAGSILVDPTGSMAKRQLPRTEPAPATSTRADDPWAEAAPPLPPPPRPPAEPPLEVILGFRVLGSAGLAPAPSMGFSIDGALRRNRFEVRLEGRSDLSVSANPLPDGAGVATTLLVGSLVPCWVTGWFRLCGVLAAGAMFARSEQLTPVERDVTFFGAVGLRPMAEVRLGGPVRLVGSLEGLLPLRNLSVKVRGNEVWSSPVVAGSASIGLQMHFL